MAKAKGSDVSFLAKPKKSCKRHAKSRTSNNKKSKNYSKPYRGQGR